MLADVAPNELAMVGGGIGQDILDEIIAKLVPSDCVTVSKTFVDDEITLTVDKGHARTVRASFAHTLQVAIKEVPSPDLQALLNHFRGILIHAVLCGKANNVVDGAAAVSGSTVFADVLDAPVAELTVSNNINAGKDLIDAGTLFLISGILRKGSLQATNLVLLQAVLKDVLYHQTARLP